MDWGRRWFLQGALAILGGARRLVGSPAPEQGPPSGGAGATARLAPGCKVFTVSQAQTVEAVAEQIIPADDHPGAKDAGVLFYIDRSLAGDLRRFRKRYESGLILVEQTSRAAYGKPFTELKWEQQTSVLQKLESDPGEGGEFFRLIRQHTMEGYYGDAKYGGNRDYVSWKMLGFKG